ncbi:hypothetical protein TNCT6_73030 [Streptomyces sp. 6-11-2]|nr:hypothetical protein TNCT6_73030 [Streptomyces sp. 6-11-2]
MRRRDGWGAARVRVGCGAGTDGWPHVYGWVVVRVRMGGPHVYGWVVVRVRTGGAARVRTVGGARTAIAAIARTVTARTDPGADQVHRPVP